MVYGIAENKEKIAVVEKSKFLVLKSAEVTMFRNQNIGGLGGHVGVEYPAGWTFNNCVVISAALTFTSINGSSNLQSVWFCGPGNYYGFMSTWNFAQTDSPMISLHLEHATGTTKVIGRFVLMRID